MLSHTDVGAELFPLLVEQVRDYAIFALDPDGHVISWNAGAELLKGYREEEIIGSHLERFYTEEDRHAGKPRQLLAQARQDGRVADEGWRVRKDGSRFWASVVITALVDHDGVFLGYGKVTCNLTKARQAEEELRHALEQVQERNRDLELFADAAVGRELKMIELKKENERLRQRLRAAGLNY